MSDDIKVSEMGTATQINEDDYIMVAQSRGDTDGYYSRKGTVGKIATTVVNEVEYSDELETNNKTIVGAINEANHLAAMGRTFGLPASPNPNAHEVQVTSENIPELAKFSGNGSTTDFVISTTSDISNIAAVIVNYVATLDYTFDETTKVISFTTAPQSGTNNIHVHYWIESEE